jgi:NAD+ synthase
MPIDLNKAIKSICGQLKEYIGNKKAVIGLSGGIDSSVVAYLCVKALGKDSVIGLALPYADQSSEDGMKIADNLGIRCDPINIRYMVEGFPKLDGLTDVSKGNIMARVRMVILYQYANHYNGMVIGTTNKTEAQIGYYTKFGDGGVDIEPIADLYKTEVFQVAKILKIPNNIIKKKPSAGLWEGQTDEDELGITYKDLDAILISLSDKKTDILDFEKEKIEKVMRLIKTSEHKKYPPPVFQVRS